jgi:hypothetical protein
MIIAVRRVDSIHQELLMSALPLLDYALSSTTKRKGRASSRQAKGRLTQFAQSLVQSVLDDLERVRLFETAVQPSEDDDAFRFDRDVAVLVRYGYEECMKRAEQVLQRVDRLQARGHKIKGAEKLRDAHGELAAMLNVSLEDIARAQEQANHGKLQPGAELRNELRAKLHK